MSKKRLQKDWSEICKKASTKEVVIMEFNGYHWIKAGKTLYIKLINK